MDRFVLVKNVVKEAKVWLTPIQKGDHDNWLWRPKKDRPIDRQTVLEIEQAIEDVIERVRMSRIDQEVADREAETEDIKTLLSALSTSIRQIQAQSEFVETGLEFIANSRHYERYSGECYAYQRQGVLEACRSYLMAMPLSLGMVALPIQAPYMLQRDSITQACLLLERGLVCDALEVLQSSSKAQRLLVQPVVSALQAYIEGKFVSESLRLLKI